MSVFIYIRGENSHLYRACIEHRWRDCSTGSESSTGSSDASVWTTNVTPKSVKGNARNSIDGWSSRRYVRGKNLEEGPLSTSIRPNNNSESSDTTDTTTATTTTTTLLKSLAVVSIIAKVDRSAELQTLAH